MAFKNKREIYKALVDGEIVMHNPTRLLFKLTDEGILVQYLDQLQMWDKVNCRFNVPEEWMLASEVKVG